MAKQSGGKIEATFPQILRAKMSEFERIPPCFWHDLFMESIVPVLLAEARQPTYPEARPMLDAVLAAKDALHSVQIVREHLARMDASNGTGSGPSAPAT